MLSHGKFQNENWACPGLHESLSLYYVLLINHLPPRAVKTWEALKKSGFLLISSPMGQTFPGRSAFY